MGHKRCPGFLQVLGDCPCLVKNSQKRGITVPAGHQVKMQVFPYAGARGLPLVEAHIDAFAMKMIFQNFRAGFQKIHQLPAFLRGQVLKLHDVPVWTDHDVTIVVWIFVHDHKTVPATVKHKPFGVLVRFGRDAEHAFIGFWPKDVTYAPGCPKLFHDKQSYTHASRPASVDLRAGEIFRAEFDLVQILFINFC